MNASVSIDIDTLALIDRLDSSLLANLLGRARFAGVVILALVAVVALQKRT